MNQFHTVGCNRLLVLVGCEHAAAAVVLQPLCDIEIVAGANFERDPPAAVVEVRGEDSVDVIGVFGSLGTNPRLHAVSATAGSPEHAVSLIPRDGHDSRLTIELEHGRGTTLR